MNDTITEKLEVVETSALESMERASIDSQVTTAKKYPRSLSTVKQSMLSFATLDIETAAGCFFTLPARKGGDGKPIQGPSIRMAEIALSCYQNLRAGARIISDDGKQITAQGVCHDLQNNVCVSVEVKRRVTNRDGRRYSDDMVIMTGNAACSIALRNATFRVVPLALVKPVYEAAKKTAVGDAKTLVQRRADSMAHFAKIGVPKEKVFAALEVKALEDIGLEHVEVLLGYATAIRDGDASVDEIFNPKPEASDVRKPIFGADDKKQGPTGDASHPDLEEGKAPPAADKKTEPAPAEEPLSDREPLIAKMKEAMLDSEVSESKLFGYAKTNKLIPEGVDELWALPTGVLAKLAPVIATLSTKAKKK